MLFPKPLLASLILSATPATTARSSTPQENRAELPFVALPCSWRAAPLPRSDQEANLKANVVTALLAMKDNDEMLRGLFRFDPGEDHIRDMADAGEKYLAPIPPGEVLTAFESKLWNALSTLQNRKPQDHKSKTVDADMAQQALAQIEMLALVNTARIASIESYGEGKKERTRLLAFNKLALDLMAMLTDPSAAPDQNVRDELERARDSDSGSSAAKSAPRPPLLFGSISVLTESDLQAMGDALNEVFRSGYQKEEEKGLDASWLRKFKSAWGKGTRTEEVLSLVRRACHDQQQPRHRRKRLLQSFGLPEEMAGKAVEFLAGPQPEESEQAFASDLVEAQEALSQIGALAFEAYAHRLGPSQTSTQATLLSSLKTLTDAQYAASVFSEVERVKAAVSSALSHFGADEADFNAFTPAADDDDFNAFTFAFDDDDVPPLVPPPTPDLHLPPPSDMVQSAHDVKKMEEFLDDFKEIGLGELSVVEMKFLAEGERLAVEGKTWLSLL